MRIKAEIKRTRVYTVMKILYDKTMRKNWMKIRKNRVLFFLIGMLLFVSGCGVRVHPTLGSDRYLQVGQRAFSGGICKLVLASYQQLCERAYGDAEEKIWSEQVTDTQTYWEYVRDQIVQEELFYTAGLSQIAENDGYEPDEAQTRKIEEAAARYYEQLDNQARTELQLKEEDVKQAFLYYWEAMRCVDELSVGVTPELSEEETRVIEIQELSFASEEEAKAAWETMEAGDLSAWDDASSAKVQDIARGQKDATYEEAAFRLQTGTYSEPLYSEGSWKILYCKSDYLEDASIANREQEYRRRKTESWKSVFDTWAGEREFWLDSSGWEKLKPVQIGELPDFFAACQNLWEESDSQAE